MAESRVYRSGRRQQQAAETRRAILSAARELFTKQGYAATALTDIAAAAEVSVPTLYASIGPKAQIARALVEFTNDQGRVAENDRLQQQAESAEELIRLNVHLVRELYERAGDVIRALKSAAEPELADVVKAGEAYHREGETAIALRLGELGALRDGVAVEEAAAVLITLNSPEVFDRFAGEGWSFDRIEAWLAGTLIELLL